MSLLSFDEAARRLGCSSRTIRRRVLSGELAHYRDRGILRVPEDALARYVAARTTRERTTPVKTTAPGARARRGRPVDATVRLWDTPDPL